MKMLKNGRFYHYLFKLLRGQRGEGGFEFPRGTVERLIRGEDLEGVKRDLKKEKMTF